MQMTRNITLLAFLFFSALSTPIWAQTNDECSGATVITDPTDFCSDTVTAIENTGLATASTQAFPTCWSSVVADLWYTFTAVAPEVVIAVKGQALLNPTGTMVSPEVALYSGDCANLTEIACAFNGNNGNNLPLFASGLVVGQQYFIRIDALTPGRFQYCVKNQADLNIAAGDCPQATFICSKSTIHVESTFNAGSDGTEMNTASCFQSAFPPFETNSSWFVFTAANAGKLLFTLTPDAPFDDLDFVLYRLPNGPGNCAGKISERCMAAGWNPGDSTMLACTGPTGLDATSSDINQAPGCPPGSDNWIRFLTLVPGRTYALVVNNFTSGGNGFTIEWGGDAIFQGGNSNTTASFTTDEPDQKICLGEELVLTDGSTAVNATITNWKWDFGVGAIADSTTGKGPHTIQYQTVGLKQIILTITNDDGCAALDTAFVLVELCCLLEADVSVVPGCPDEPAATPAIATVAVQNGLDPLTVTWSNNPANNTTTDSIDASGTYTVTVVDANGCSDSQSFTVNTPLNVSAMFPRDTSILLGESVTLSTSAIPTDSLLVLWIDEKGDTLTGSTQVLMPTDTVTYYVVVNNTGCEFSDSVTIIVRKPRYERPNAFTPNGDGSNDTFGPVLVGNTLIQLEVWSRWGEKIFDSISAGSNTWDGTINGVPAPSDVYVYRMRVKLIEGGEKVDKGDVTLLR